VESAAKNDQYWGKFTVLPADLDYLVNFLLEGEDPKTIEGLTIALIEHRCQQLESLMQESLSRGRVYRPGETYAEGETLIFPHLGSVLGEVVSVRPGHNPECEPFSVIRVRMEGGTEREFAAELQSGHSLDEATYVPAGEVGADELYAQYGEQIKKLLRESLERDSHFVAVAGKWFVRDLVMEVTPVQLNIAEAMLDMTGGEPLPTTAFLNEMDLPKEIPQPLQIFSLEYALERDRRFDEVGPSGQASWCLRRMEPKQVLETPPHLRYVPIPYNRNFLDEMMLSLEMQVDDEWSEMPFEGALEGTDTLTVTLTYPHWRSGTLPLTSKLIHFFPTARLADHVRFTFVDGHTGKSFPGWVVRSGRYVYGLSSFYEEYKVEPGSYFDLTHGAEPGSIVVSTRPFRSRRGEWLRTVSVDGDAFSFEVTRYPVLCEFDELTAIGVPDPKAVDALGERLRHLALGSLIKRVFQGVAVLSLQRAVHAATLYSVLNLLRRVPLAPMLAVLTTERQDYVSLGDHYWAYKGED
jgi:hypothetical protein